MSWVGPDTYRVGSGNILQFQRLNQLTALHGNPSSITVFTGSRHWTNIHSQKPLTMHKTPFIFLFCTNARVSIQFRPATPRLLTQQLRSEPRLSPSYVANVTIFTNHFRSNKMQSPLST